MTLELAYRACRTTARREAKNFYYAFLALPKPKRDAICAVYAFMRFADDLSDDEALPHDVRRANLDHWMDDWRAAAAGAATEDAVFTALNDARKRFHIPLGLLEQLVEGTAMDLNSQSLGGAHGLDTYATFQELYQYCYLVASVVGLVSIRIFGYSDPGAEALAEELGIGFQLTNILRDVKEDAERGRIYLPVEDLAACGIDPEAVRAKGMSEPLRQVLAREAERAETFYASGEALLPLIDSDSRPALWVLIEIYYRLLMRIREAEYDVFRERIRVSGAEKLWLLARGLGQTARARLRRAGGA